MSEKLAQATLLTDTVTRLADGFEFIEGPVWQSDDSRLIFNDIPGDTTYAWSEHNGLSVLRRPSHKANGQAIDPLGRRIVCEHLTSAVVRITPEGERDVLADRYGERALNSPNDVIIGPDGSVIFTDPPFGRTEAAMGAIRPMELGFCGVFRWSTDHGLQLLSTRLAEPNGLCLSLDGARLYVNDTATGEIIEFKTSWNTARLVVDEGRVFARVPDSPSGKADGMKVDAGGNLWCTGAGGIHVFDPAGEPVGLVEVDQRVGNFAWGGVDGRDLYITASTSLYRTRTRVAGADWV